MVYTGRNEAQGIPQKGTAGERGAGVGRPARQLTAEMDYIRNNVNQIAREVNQTQTVQVCRTNRMLEMLHELQRQAGALTKF